jgi:hypothetical protein
MKPKIVIVMSLFLCTSCMSEWLEVRPNKTIVLIGKMSDMRALLDNTEIMNTTETYLGEASADHYVLSETTWSNLSILELKNASIWAKDIFEDKINSCWEFVRI